MTDTTMNTGAGLDLTKKEFERACELLPPDFFWGLPVTPRLVLDIAQAALATPQADAAPIGMHVAALLAARDWLTDSNSPLALRNQIDAAIAAGGAQEPVAWMTKSDGYVFYGYNKPDRVEEGLVPLYAAPLPREAATVALTDEQIVSIWEGMPDGASGFRKSWGYMQFARALLAASNGEQETGDA